MNSDSTIAYQSSGIGTINTEQRNWGPDLLGWGGIGAQGVASGSARNGELLSGGAQASAGDASREHCVIERAESLDEEGGGKSCEERLSDSRSAAVSMQE